MKNDKRVIRFEATGPATTGMPAMKLDPADFQSALPEQHLHVYFEDEALGLSLGVWTTTGMLETFGPYPGDEFMRVLEGQVDMIDGDGNATHVKEGETFYIPNGTPTSWKQVGFLRKFYMTYENPNTPAMDAESATGGVMVLDPAVLESGLEKMDTTDPFQIDNGPTLQHDSSAFVNDAGNMFVGMWDSEAFESAMLPFPCYEFVQLLEGQIVITEDDGTSHEFNPGDAFFIPAGTVCSWKTTGYVKKFYSIFDPSA